MNKTKTIIYPAIFIVITFLFFFLRLYHFEKLLTFHLDQGLHLKEAWQMVDDKKLRLIGPIVSTRVFDGRGFFIGPQYYYILAILGLITGWSVQGITLSYIIMWWVAGLALFIFLAKRLSPISALLAYGIYATWPFLVNFSRLFWNPNTLPFISIFYFYFIYLIFTKNKKFKKYLWFLLGAITGFGISFHYSVASWLFIDLAFFVVMVFKKNVKVLDFLLLFLGLAVGNLPVVIFELRHNFYNIRTVIFFFKNQVLTGQDAGVTGYYGFSYLIALLALIAFIFHKIEKIIGQKFSIIMTILIIGLIFFQNDLKQKKGIGMPDGWNIIKQQQVADYIVKDLETGAPQNFEVATAISGDIRGDDLRWWLIKKGHPAMNYDSYPEADSLYLIAYSDLNPSNTGTWEIATLYPFDIKDKIDLKDNMYLYKIVRQ